MSLFDLFLGVGGELLNRNQLKKNYPDDLPIFDQLFHALHYENDANMMFEKIPGHLGVRLDFVGGLFNTEKVSYYVLMQPDHGSVFHAWLPKSDFTDVDASMAKAFVNWLNNNITVGLFSLREDRKLMYLWGFEYHSLDKKVIAKLSRSFSEQYVELRKSVNPVIKEFLSGNFSFDKENYSDVQIKFNQKFTHGISEVKESDPFVSFIISTLGENKLLYSINDDEGVIAVNHPKSSGVITKIKLNEGGALEILSYYPIFSTSKGIDRFLDSEYYDFINSSGKLTDAVIVDPSSKSLILRSGINLEGVSIESKQLLLSRFVDTHLLKPNVKYTEVGRFEEDINEKDVFSDMVDVWMGLGERYDNYFQPLSEKKEKAQKSFKEIPTSSEISGQESATRSTGPSNKLDSSDSSQDEQKSQSKKQSENKNNYIWIIIPIVGIAFVGFSCMCLFFFALV